MKKYLEISLLIILLFTTPGMTLFAQYGHWEELKPLNSPPPMTGLGMATLTDGKVILFGGFNGKFQNDTWLFDISNNNWIKLNIKNRPPGRSLFGITQISDGKILMFDGGSADSIDFNLNDTWLFDGQTMDWTKVQTNGTTFKLANFSFSNIDDKNVILFGGDAEDTNMFGAVPYTWIFNLDNKSWRLFDFFGPNAREGAVMAMLDTGKIIVFGGSSVDTTYNDSWLLDINSIPLKWNLINPNPNAAPINRASMIHLEKNIVLWFGGYITGLIGKNDTWLYTLNNNSWRIVIVNEKPQSRDGHGFAKLTKNKVLMFGGEIPGNYIGDTWILTIDSLTDVNERMIDLKKDVIINTNIINNQLTFDYSLSKPSNIQFDLINLNGNILKRSINHFNNCGYFNEHIDINEISNGAYFLKLNSDFGTVVKKIVLIK